MKFDLKKLRAFIYIDDIIDSVKQQFPRVCNCCGLEFKDFLDFLDNTYIPEHTNSHNIQIIKCNNNTDIVAYRNCSCQSTITVSCVIGENLKRKMFIDIEKDVKEFGVEFEFIMESIRNYILETLSARVN